MTGVARTPPHEDHALTHRTGLTWAIWLGVLFATTLGLFFLRGQLDKAHVVLAFLIVVLGGSAAGGRMLGVSLAVLAFVLFDFVFLPPYYTLDIENPWDWFVLGAFLVTGIVAAQLLSRAQERAEAARQRAIEVERLATLGAETLNAGRAEDALAAIMAVIRTTIGVSCCEVLVPGGEPVEFHPLSRAGTCDDSATPARGASALAAWVAAQRAPAAEREDGTTWVGPELARSPFRWPADGAGLRALLVPLIVRDRVVGVLRIVGDAPITLDPAQDQFLRALSYYAALGVERVRLVAEAERAEALRQADALKNALVATVSHDLRTPLTTIKALAHGLARRGEADAMSIEQEADRLNRFVADLLDLSRLSAGAYPVHVELNAAQDLVGAALERVRGALGTREIRIVRAEGEPVLFGTFDLVQSMRVLVNLLENAIKYSPSDTPIEVWVDRADSRLRITVADRGPGVADADVPLIFEPFYRPRGTAPDAGGAGLGLAIARGLAEAQHGVVRYQPRQGGGSLFTLELPATDVPSLEAYEAAPASGTQVTNKET